MIGTRSVAFLILMVLHNIWWFILIHNFTPFCFLVMGMLDLIYGLHFHSHKKKKKTFIFRQYNDDIMIAMAFHITDVLIVFWTVCSDTDQRKHKSSRSLAFVKGKHRWTVDSPHKGPVRWKMFPFGDVIKYRFCQNCKFLIVNLYMQDPQMSLSGGILTCTVVRHINLLIWAWAKYGSPLLTNLLINKISAFSHV